MPKISIIVPIYNVEKYLHRCIDSVLAQTFTDFELILVNDGSPDNCGKICDEYAERDSRIVVVHKENGGLSSARNAGLDVAKGDYIAFIDSDDFVHPQTYEILYKTIINEKADLIECCIFHTDSQNLPEFPPITDYKISELSIRDICSKIFTPQPLLLFSANTKLCKADIFKTLRFPKGFTFSEDAYIHSDILDKCNKIIKIDCKLYYYYNVRNDSICNTMNIKSLFYNLDSINRNLQYLLENAYADISQSLAQKYILSYLDLYYTAKGEKELKETLKKHNKLFKINSKKILNNCGLGNLYKTIIRLSLINPMLARGLFKKALK